MIQPTAEEQTLAIELYGVGAQAAGMSARFNELPKDQSQAWFAIARHVRAHFAPIVQPSTAPASAPAS